MSNIFINCQLDDKSVNDFANLSADDQQLITAAIGARNMAYCPYNKCAIGAAIRTTDGSVYTGCNIENSSFPAGICAEKTAAAKAISEGKREFVALAVVAQRDNVISTPCGLCRQFLSEFLVKGRNLVIYCAKPGNPPLRVLSTSLEELLPKSSC